MTTYRLVKSKSIEDEFIENLIHNFNNWKEEKEYFKGKPKGRYLEEIIPTIKGIKFEKPSINLGNSASISYSTEVKVTGSPQKIWIESENCRIFYPKKGYLILQQPSNAFERLLRLKLEMVDRTSLKSPFYSIKAIRLLNNIENSLRDLNFGEFWVYRIIFQDVQYDNQDFLEFNVKKDEITKNFIKKIENNSKRWHALSIKVEIQLEIKAIKRVSLRFDRFGKCLLYGIHDSEIDNLVGLFLTQIIQNL